MQFKFNDFVHGLTRSGLVMNFGKKIGRTMIAILSVLILIALAACAFLYFEAQSYLNKNLSEFVAKKSLGIRN